MRNFHTSGCREDARPWGRQRGTLGTLPVSPGVAFGPSSALVARQTLIKVAVSQTTLLGQVVLGFPAKAAPVHKLV